MRFSASLVLFFLALAGVGAAQVPPPIPPPPPPTRTAPSRDTSTQDKVGTAVLAGRVTSADGRPLRRAQVRATAPELREGRTVSTDAEGRWRLKEMPAGRYALSVSKGGYVTIAYGQRRSFEQGKPIELADGQTLANVDVALPRGGVVTGRIADEYGEPLTGVRVSAVRYRFSGGQRRLMAVGAGVTTDDIGQYRLYGLSPGEYYVAATLGGIILSLDKSDDKTSYLTTYFPGATAVADAQRVTVPEGQEVQGVSFALAAGRVAKVSGTAVSSAGKPLVAGAVLMTATSGATEFIGVARLTPDGKFSFSSVPAGEYMVQLTTEVDAAASAPTTGSMTAAEVAVLPLTVTGADVSDIAVVTAPMAVAKGRLTFDGGKPPAASPGSMSVTTGSTSVQGGSVGGGQVRVREDWTFESTGIVGRRTLRTLLPPGWWLRSVMLNGTDVTDSGIDFKPGETIAGFDLLVTNRMASLSGSVLNAKGQPVNDYAVVAFASDSSKWGYATRFVRNGRPDQSGQFRITGLPGEDYLVVALDYLEPGEESDPELLERLRAQATAIKLRDGEEKTIVLKQLVTRGS